ncbi:MAG: efflux RND transporter permease subunit [Spirochaetes bacterium]|nr:efflux RND transporter permease subunit [Spirochaetota bacterium]
MKKFIEYLLKNSLIINLISVSIVIAGLLFMFNANREAFPQVDFGWVIIQTVYPGATPVDVEKLVSKPIEDQLREVNNIKQVSSSSLESISFVACELDPDLKNKDKTIQLIKDAVAKVNDLPDDVEDPVVTELSMAEIPVLRVSIMNKNGIQNDDDEFELRNYAKRMQDQLMMLEGAAEIKMNGYRDREMHVEVSLDKLDEYYVALNTITGALSAKNINFPGGIAQDNNEDVVIRTIGEFDTAEDISVLAIRANDVGGTVSIGDVANVRDTLAKEEIINKVNGAKSITLTIISREKYDVITLVEKAREIVTEYQEVLPENYEVVLTDDLSKYVIRRLDVLKGNGLLGIILVILALFIALGWRISLVTALGLPIAFTGTFWFMGVQGISINLISMFALIMVLGMLVDDAIIVAENIYRHLEEGDPLLEAVVNGTHEVMIPVAGTIMTTIAAFAPLLFMGGIMGKFMWALPACVSIALTMSWIESMLILPSHIYDVEKRFKHREKYFEKKQKKKEKHESKTSRFQLRKRYVSTLALFLRHKFIFIALLLVFFFGSVGFAVKKVEFELFPGGGIEVCVVLMEASSGTSLEVMDGKVRRIEETISSLPAEYVESFVSRTGFYGQDEGDPNGKLGSKYASIIINLTPFQQRDVTAEEILEQLRKETESISSELNKIEFKMVENGPPSDGDVNISVRGEEFDVLEKIADEYSEYLHSITGVENVADNYEAEKREMRIYVNQGIAMRTGISVFDVASTVRICYEGSVATSIKRSEEEIDVRVILPKESRQSLDRLDDIKIANRTGGLIPLKEVAIFEEGIGISAVSRKGWRRSIDVTADIVPPKPKEGEELSFFEGIKKAFTEKPLTAIDVNLMVMEKFKDIERRYPGYSVSYEGEFKDTEDAFIRLRNSYIIAMLAIYIILVALFHNLRQPLIVMSIIPFTLTGVIWSFFFHGLPLSFMALMGVVGLGGVVVNDSIVYVDFINKARDRGEDTYTASLDAGYKRLRPILLTTITTIVGLIPTAYGLGGSDPFLVPMAVAMAYGLMFGTTITLFATPVIYNIFYRKACKEGIKSCLD